jgi:hypothetical protein
MYVDELVRLHRLIQEEGPIVVGIDRRTPIYLVDALDKQFANDEGARYESPFHIVYVRGIEVRLPEGLKILKRPFSAYYLPLNRELSFRNQEVEAYLGRGWDWEGRGTPDPEAYLHPFWRLWRAGSSGSWSVGARAIFHLNLKRAVALRLEWQATTYKAQRIVIELNGQTLHTIQGDGTWTTYSVFLPETLLKLDNEVAFRFPDARSPLSLGESADSRRLGMLVRSMRFDVIEGKSRGRSIGGKRNTPVAD